MKLTLTIVAAIVATLLNVTSAADLDPIEVKGNSKSPFMHMLGYPLMGHMKQSSFSKMALNCKPSKNNQLRILLTETVT